MLKVEFHKSNQMDNEYNILQRQWVLYGSYFLCKSKVYRKVLGIKIREYPRAEQTVRHEQVPTLVFNPYCGARGGDP